MHREITSTKNSARALKPFAKSGRAAEVDVGMTRGTMGRRLLGWAKTRPRLSR